MNANEKRWINDHAADGERADQAAQDHSPDHKHVIPVVGAELSEFDSRQIQIAAEIKLGAVAVSIGHLVKKHHISTVEWNLKTDRVERFLGRLLRQRDDLIKTIERERLRAVREDEEAASKIE